MKMIDMLDTGCYYRQITDNDGKEHSVPVSIVSRKSTKHCLLALTLLKGLVGDSVRATMKINGKETAQTINIDALIDYLSKEYESQRTAYERDEARFDRLFNAIFSAEEKENEYDEFSCTPD